MSRSFLDWLRSAPVRDPLDRRNAPVMQVLFLFLGITTPGTWTYQFIGFGMPVGGWVSIAAAAAVTVACFFCIWLIRLGHFRQAVIVFLCTLLVSLEVTHLASGFRRLLMSQIDQILILIISALVLGRRALWLCFAALCVVALSGGIVDAGTAARNGKSVVRAFTNLPPALLTYLVIALVLDHTVKALRESLAESEAAGRELLQEMAERERTQAQLVQAQKREATGRLAAGIAHDFGNLLNVIRGFARQREVDDGLPDRDRVAMLEGAMEGIEQASDRGIATTRKLLTFNRGDALRLEWFDPGRVVRELEPMLRQLFPAQVHVRVDCATDGASICLDRSEFELMVLNVAANARDAMPDGGRFEVAVRAAGAEAVEIAMSDSGTGMEPRVLERVFEPFFSTKPAARGTGLGLSVIHDLVDVAGGAIAIDSAPGAGTCVRIRFPSRSGGGGGPASVADEQHVALPVHGAERQRLA